MTIEKQIEADVSVLMYRTFFKKQIHVFGEDGFGKYGRNDLGKTFEINDIDIEVDLNEDTGEISGIVYLVLDDYDENDCGLILSDQNAEISIRKLLKDEYIDPHALRWARKTYQGPDYIAMTIDIPLLLDWT